MASQRAAETIEAAESRRRAVAERAQQRRLIFSRNTWGVFDKAAFDYDESLYYETHNLITIEMMNKVDFAMLSNGKRKLQACVARVVVELLKELFSNDTDESTRS